MNNLNRVFQMQSHTHYHTNKNSISGRPRSIKYKAKNTNRLLNNSSYTTPLYNKWHKSLKKKHPLKIIELNKLQVSSRDHVAFYTSTFSSSYLPKLIKYFKYIIANLQYNKNACQQALNHQYNARRTSNHLHPNSKKHKTPTQQTNLKVPYKADPPKSSTR